MLVPVSIIIPTYNRRESLRRTLLSLTVTAYDPEALELVIADTGSNDGTDEMVRGLDLPCSLTYLPLKKRYLSDAPLARNAGAQKARGEILIFIDSDELVRPAFIEEHTFAHEQVPHALVAGPVFHLLAPAPSEEKVRKGFSHYDTFGLLASWQAAMMEFAGNVNCCRYPWSYCFGGNYSLRKSDSATVGPIDESFAANSLEGHDTEFAYRCYLNGLKVMFNRNAVVYHDWGAPETITNTTRTRRVLDGFAYVNSEYQRDDFKAYSDFRAQEYELFLEGLLQCARERTFPVLASGEVTEWMNEMLRFPCPLLSIIVFSYGDHEKLARVLSNLDKQTQLARDYEVLLYDTVAAENIGCDRRDGAADLFIQSLSLSYCLRYYAVAPDAPHYMHDGEVTHSSDGEHLLDGSSNSEPLKRDFHMSPQGLSLSLSRVGWYFAAIRALRGRVRGQFVHLIDQETSIPPTYVAECLASKVKESALEAGKLRSRGQAQHGGV